MLFNSSRVTQDTMKELEKIAPKQKGIVSQSVKEITQLLVDEGLVECEKIGTFRRKKLEELDEAISNSKAKLAELKEIIKEARKGKEVSDEIGSFDNASKERTEREKQIADLQKKHEELKAKLEKLCEDGPEALTRLQADVDKARDAANRWTDNIFAAKKWCKRKFGAEDKMLDAQFGIPPDFDYVE
ncbi:unnamed protein product [Gongylonema pulchrum]|uniref:Meiotic nuclear division protein 1 homolog n=1 Tax=Gongylonema pulchrum TaxID=637853 RepID=A0A183DP15_9BILA|nr:unnamed protein product [Gongylonema pulchrum]